MERYQYVQEPKQLIPPRVALMILSLASLAVSISMADADKIGSIVAGIIAAAGLLFVISKGVQEWITWRNPFGVTYLIPGAKYPKAEFPGNSKDEQYPTSMEVDIGEHQIMFRVTPKVDAQKDDITLQFIGDGSPEIINPESNPFIVHIDEKSGKKLDWWGIWHENGANSCFRKGEYHALGYKIKADMGYSGKARISFKVKGKKNVVVIDLPFEVRAG